MRAWLNETHATTFELLRHFLLRFFDSDLVTSPGHTALAVIGSSSMFLSWFPFFTGPLKEKYVRLLALPSLDLYRLALRADELWLLAMMMSAIGLLTVIKSGALFPGKADYGSPVWLPIKPRQIFVAKFIALLTVATAAILVLTLLPAVGFAALSGAHAAPVAAALLAGSYFMFFALVAFQGFTRTNPIVQAVLAAAILIALVLSFSIGPPFARAVTRPEIVRWLPPVWFLGICDPALSALAPRAYAALAISAILAIAAYAASYRRHRILTMESLAGSTKARRWTAPIFDWLVPDPREQAIVTYLAKGIAANGPHRMVLMGYLGFGLAVLLTGMLGTLGIVTPSHLAASRFVYGHVVMFVFLLLGLRHLFSIPLELKANWLFRISERQGKTQWRTAVDRLVLAFAFLALAVLPSPWEARLLGWRAVTELALFLIFALATYESVFASWHKLPLTCSYLPGKSPMWMLAIRLLALLTALPLVNAVFLAALYVTWLYLLIFMLLTGIWLRSCKARRESWSELPLLYEEAPDPAIQALHLLR